MPTFEEVPDNPTPAYAVVKKAVEADAWTLLNTVFATEAEATQKAQELVGLPDNYFAARVLKPTGSLFKDSE